MKLIQQKISLEQQIQALAKTLQEYQGEITMTDQEKFNYFKQQKRHFHSLRIRLMKWI